MAASSYTHIPIFRSGEVGRHSNFNSYPVIPSLKAMNRLRTSARTEFARPIESIKGVFIYFRNSRTVRKYASGRVNIGA
jgi:hypothetical protein